MKIIRRLAWVALVVASLHLIFGAIVRISGSGMGCGDNWPKCYGHWFPPLDRPDLIVEVSHRYLASLLVLTVLSLVLVCWIKRGEPGVSGRGGPLRSAIGAVVAVFTAALLGGLTVKLGNVWYATIAHWSVAMTLLALVATTAIRAGALGGASTAAGSARTMRGARVAAIMAAIAVAMGGATAKYPGAPVACLSFPLCGRNPASPGVAAGIQIFHRTVAVLLVLHLIGMASGVTRRRATESPVVFTAVWIAMGAGLLQLGIAGAMIGLHLPPVLRSLHEATGVMIWLSCFSFAYLAQRAAGRTP